MRIVAIDSYGDTPTVREIDFPTDLAPDELLVRVHAAGVNPVDSMIARGTWRVLPVKFPLTLGLDFAGVVERTGAKVKQYRAGEAVYGRVSSSPVMQHGAYADYVVIPESGTVSPIPEPLDFAQAAALPSAAMTALTSVDAAGVEKGSHVLIVGAPGGVGSYAVQFANRRGAHVIATALDDDTEYVKGLGAKATIDYTRGDLADAVSAAFFAGIDSLLDFASDAPALSVLSKVVRRGGSVVSTRYVADVEALASRNVRGTNIANKPTRELLQRVTQAVVDGQLGPVEIRTYPLEQAAAALDQFVSGHVRGKIVLLMNPS